jgi:hypothetical protein
MQTYDNGVVSLFTIPTTDARDVSVNYIGVVKDIFKLNYGPLSSSIVLLRCQWAKQRDNWGNTLEENPVLHNRLNNDCLSLMIKI